MQVIKLGNHEIMNHNPIIYLIECLSCVLVYLCFDGRLCFLELYFWNYSSRRRSFHLKSSKKVTFHNQRHQHESETGFCLRLLLVYEYCAEMSFTSFENPEMPLNLS